MAGQGRLGREPGLEGHALLRDLVLAHRGLAGGGGEIAQVVVPLGGLQQLALHGPVFLGQVRGVGILGDGGLRALLVELVLLEQRILQEFLLHGLHQLQPGQLQQLDGLLQLGRHHQLLRKLELLS